MRKGGSKVGSIVVMGCLIAVPVGFFWKVLTEEQRHGRELEAVWDEGARSAAIVEGERVMRGTFTELAVAILDLVADHGSVSVGEIVAATGQPRGTVKKRLGVARVEGRGRRDGE